MLMTKPPQKAAQNPSTVKELPGRMPATNHSKSALSTRIKSPIVTRISGRQRISKTGRTIALMIPSNRDAKTSPVKLVYWMPGTIHAATKTATAVTNHRIRNSAREIPTPPA